MFLIKKSDIIDGRTKRILGKTKSVEEFYGEMAMEKLARQAMLNISDAEKLKNDIETVLNTMKILDEIETVEYVPRKGSLRDDEVRVSFERDEILKNAVSQDGFVVVPRVVEK